MNLLNLAAVAGEAGELIDRARSALAQAPAWTTDEEAFARHFGATVEDYEQVKALLSPDQQNLLKRTLAVNPEAAVLWVLAMEVVG